MNDHLTQPDPRRFGLARFSDVLAPRATIPGEAPGTFEDFRESLLAALAPATPYEAVVAENLVRLEWEMVQTARIRDATIARQMRERLVAAVDEAREFAHEAAGEEAQERHLAAHGTLEGFSFEPFDPEAARQAGAALARRAVDPDPAIREAAEAEIAALGLEPVELLAEIWGENSAVLAQRDKQLRELEKRRREIGRDYERLQAARPIEARPVTE